MARPKKELSNPVIPNELEELRAKIAVLEAQVNKPQNQYEEIRQAKNRGMADTAKITYRHFTDNKKVALYHTNGIHIGKKIGPLHPGSIESTFERFKDKGIILSIHSPTPEQVSEYMKSDEYKTLELRQRQIKAQRYKGPETKEDIKRLTDAMVTIAGIAKKDILNIKPQEVVA